ncbi:MAG: hypothetical protein AAGE59_25990 [Cyanobacteria bacterium P01_F01_bin.86]
MQLNAQIREKIQAFRGGFPPEFSTYTFADPATYVIGQDSIIQWAYVPNNYRKRAEPEAIIAQLKTL